MNNARSWLGIDISGPCGTRKERDGIEKGLVRLCNPSPLFPTLSSAHCLCTLSSALKRQSAEDKVRKKKRKSGAPWLPGRTTEIFKPHVSFGFSAVSILLHLYSNEFPPLL